MELYVDYSYDDWNTFLKKSLNHFDANRNILYVETSASCRSSIFFQTARLKTILDNVGVIVNFLHEEQEPFIHVGNLHS